MESRRAIEELRKLHAQADTPEIQRSGPEHKAWKAKVEAVMEGGLGKESETLRGFRQQRYSLGVWSGAPGETQRDAVYFAKRVRDAAALIEAAIYELELHEGTTKGDGVVASEGPIFLVHGRNDARQLRIDAPSRPNH